MKQTLKLFLIVFLSTLTILGIFIWMPNMAGPDGLEQSLYDITGNENYEPNSDFIYGGAPFPDYEFQGIENGLIHNWFMGIVGSLFALFIVFGFFKVILLKKPKI